MKNITKFKKTIQSSVLGLSAGALLLASPVAVFAHGNGGGDNQSSQQSHARSTQVRTASTQVKHDDKSQANASWNRDKHRNDPKPSPTCAELQASLNNRASASLDKKQKQLTGMNIVLNGVQTYVTSGSVTVPNYDSLNATATASQANSTTSVNGIVAPQLDCNDTANLTANNKVAQDTLNKSIWAAQKSLNTYRHDVMKLFEAVVNTDV